MFSLVFFHATPLHTSTTGPASYLQQRGGRSVRKFEYGNSQFLILERGTLRRSMFLDSERRPCRRFGPVCLEAREELILTVGRDRSPLSPFVEPWKRRHPDSIHHVVSQYVLVRTLFSSFLPESLQRMRGPTR
jgi:hypothetical protein